MGVFLCLVVFLIWWVNLPPAPPVVEDTPTIQDTPVVIEQPADPSPDLRPVQPDLSPPVRDADVIRACSFNIQFLGHSRRRDHEALAAILEPYDLVLVQELVAPPYAGKFPNGKSYKPDPQARSFFEAMKKLGFSYILSEEDTSKARNHSNSPGSEWWVAFYRDDVLDPAEDLPRGFISEIRVKHPVFSRVPYAFAFRTDDKRLDFVAVSVHLAPDPGKKARATRRREISAIADWVEKQMGSEEDVLIVGDMNVHDKKELVQFLPDGWNSLNDECRDTSANRNGSKPYDHVLYRARNRMASLDTGFDCKVVDLRDKMQPFWKSADPYPGGASAYDHDNFRAWYSDHMPLEFRLKIPEKDTD